MFKTKYFLKMQELSMTIVKYFLKMQELGMTIVTKKALVTFHLDRFAIIVGISALFVSSSHKTPKGFIKKLTE